jgi:hypothetical protein
VKCGLGGRSGARLEELFNCRSSLTFFAYTQKPPEEAFLIRMLSRKTEDIKLMENGPDGRRMNRLSRHVRRPVQKFV